MGLGIKTKIIKTIKLLKRPVFLYKNLNGRTFPKQPTPGYMLNARLNSAYHDLKDIDLKHNIGIINAKANKHAVKIYNKFISTNSNNLGNWSIKPQGFGTRQLEYEVIHKIINLYKGDKKNLEGYVTSGGTEGNLYAVWAGKNMLTKKYNLDQICLLKTSLAHYSFDKACSICSIKQINIPIDEKTWSMDPKSLETVIIEQIKKGVYGFIISLTFGYAATGTSDNIKLINDVLKKLKRIHKKAMFSICVDAALNGLTEPFVNSHFNPFSIPDLHVLSIDFSKFPAVPYPSGVVIYRKKIRKVIEREVSLFPVPDNTILGSRPGASVAAIWGVIHYYGYSGYKKMVLNQINVKKYFLEKISSLFPDTKIINDPTSLACGVVFNNNNPLTLPKYLQEQYRIYASSEQFIFKKGVKKKIKIYKFVFLPHITKQSVNEILESIKKYNPARH